MKRSSDNTPGVQDLIDEYNRTHIDKNVMEKFRNNRVRYEGDEESNYRVVSKTSSKTINAEDLNGAD